MLTYTYHAAADGLLIVNACYETRTDTITDSLAIVGLYSRQQQWKSHEASSLKV